VSDEYKFTLTASDKTKAAFDSVNKSLKKTQGNVASYANKTGESLGDAGRKAGMASIQFQQFFGQLQGGVNPMVAISQQGADLGIVLGAPLLGAVVGISAALSTLLLPAVFNSKSALQELEKITNDLKDTFTVNANGVVDFSDSLRRLAERSEALAKVQLSTSISEVNKQIKIANKEIQSLIIDLSQGTFKDFNQIIKDSGVSINDVSKAAGSLVGSLGKINANDITSLESTISGLSRKLGISRTQAVGLAQAFSEFTSNKTPETAKALESAIAGLNQETGFGSEKLRKFTEGLIPFFDSVNEGSGLLVQLQKAFGDLNKALSSEDDQQTLKNTVDLTKELASQVAIAELMLNGNTQEAERLQFAIEKGFNSFKEMPKAAQALFTVKQSIAEQQKQEINDQQKLERLAKAKTEEEKRAILENQRKNQLLLNTEQSLALQVLKLEEGERAAFELSTALRLGLDSTEQLPENIQKLINKLYELKESEPELSFFEKLKEQIQNTTNDFDAMWGRSFDRFTAGIGDATASAIVEGKNFGDTMKTFARSAIQEVISGIIQIGIKKTVLAGIEKTILASSTAANSAAAVAQGTIAASAWAPAAAFASLATGGANAIPAATALSSTVALSEGLAALSSFDGGGYTGDGARIGGIDGKGGRLAVIHPQEFVTDLTKGANANGISSNQQITVNFPEISDSDFVNKWNRNRNRIISDIRVALSRPN
jgi:hypothetical protein